jgi:hypothetical protein
VVATLRSEIPIYDPKGRLLTFAPISFIEENAGHFRLVRSRKGHVRRCYLRDDDGSVVRYLLAARKHSKYGHSFLQRLSCGQAWVLSGVTGSENA